MCGIGIVTGNDDIEIVRLWHGWHQQWYDNG